jgi:phosphomannomutase
MAGSAISLLDGEARPVVERLLACAAGRSVGHGKGDSLVLRVSVSGVRGIIGDGLDAVTAARWATALGAWLPAGPVVVGRDTRPSGPMVRDAVCAALASTGHDVRDIGIATTPTTEMAVQESDAVGGIIITASHNPQPWNALKFLEGRGLFLDAAQNAEVRQRYEAGDGHVRHDALGSVTVTGGADDLHLDAILALPWLEPDRIAACGLHAVVDAVEGAGGAIVPALLARLGVRCTPLGCGLSGRFPHDPEPTPAHLAELIETVKTSGADLGLAVDPDVDRLALVADGGVALSEEVTLVLAADFLLARQPGDLAVNLSTTGLIETVAARHGARVHRTPWARPTSWRRSCSTAACSAARATAGSSTRPCTPVATRWSASPWSCSCWPSAGSRSAPWSRSCRRSPWSRPSSRPRTCPPARPWRSAWPPSDPEN